MRAYAAFINRVSPVPLREFGTTSLEELGRKSQRPDAELPSLFASLLPIVLPVSLVTLDTAFTVLARAHPGLDAPGGMSPACPCLSGEFSRSSGTRTSRCSSRRCWQWASSPGETA